MLERSRTEYTTLQRSRTEYTTLERSRTEYTTLERSWTEYTTLERSWTEYTTLERRVGRVVYRFLKRCLDEGKTAESTHLKIEKKVNERQIIRARDYRPH